MKTNYFQNKKEFEFQINRLKKSLKFIKNEEKMRMQIKLINSMILMLQQTEMLAKADKQFEIVDKLILILMYKEVSQFQFTGGLDIEGIVKKIGVELDLSLDFHKRSFINLVKDCSSTAISEADMSLLEKAKRLAKLGSRTTEEFIPLLENDINEIKAFAKWN